MAQPGTASTTTASQLGNTVPQWLDRVLLEWMRPTYRFYTFAAKRPLPTGEGKTVTWNRKVAFAPGYVLSEGSPISAVKTLSTNKISALVEQIGDSVVVSDLARLASVTDTDAYATAVMADQAANTVELYIIAQIVIDSTVTHFVKKAGSVAEGQVSVVVSAGSGQRLALSDIRVAATRLQSMDAPTYDGQNYIGILSPKQQADLYADSGFTNWVQYTAPDKMYDFEVGRVFNVRLMTSNRVPVTAGSAFNSFALSTTGQNVLAYGMTIFGKDAFGVTELDGGIKTFKSTGASKTDPNNLTDVYAWKANIAAKVLNPSAITFIWNSVGESAGSVASKSALYNAGFTIKNPSGTVGTTTLLDSVINAW